MIQRLKYSEIEFDKYRACISNACQPNFFAQAEILNERCEAWEILVKNDYEYVMPVPLKKKWGRNFVLMPLFVQQLGVFSAKDSASVNSEFVDFLKSNYSVYTYNLNSANNFKKPLATKKNYRISTSPYGENFKKYFKGRKSSVKSAAALTFEEIQLDRPTELFIRDNFRGLNKKKDLESFIRFLKFLGNADKLKMYGVLQNETLLSVACISFDEKTNYLLALINEPRQHTNAPSKLIDSMLRELLPDSNFDFMGGNIRGIEVFFKSFGAENVPYSVLVEGKISLLKKMILFR